VESPDIIKKNRKINWPVHKIAGKPGALLQASEISTKHHEISLINTQIWVEKTRIKPFEI
jgi:hypothetical protein